MHTRAHTHTHTHTHTTWIPHVLNTHSDELGVMNKVSTNKKNYSKYIHADHGS